MQNRTKIIVKLTGRLGNQMFQYAAGLALAKKNEGEIEVDISEYKIRRREQDYALTKLVGEIAQADASSIARMIGLALPLSPFSKMYWRILARLESSRWIKEHWLSKSYLREPHFQYWPELKSQTGDCFIYGVWQSELYFKEYREEILNSFSLRKYSCDFSRRLGEEIMADRQSVAVHVRRGDYLNQKTALFHGICGMDYYTQALKLMNERLLKTKFYIFSDDVPWAQEQLGFFPNTRVIAPPKDCDDVDSLWLMRSCRHQIIANSSFSWWAAWLNPNPEKIVIAPRRWFQTPEVITRDVYPRDWILI